MLFKELIEGHLLYIITLINGVICIICRFISMSFNAWWLIITLFLYLLVHERRWVTVASSVICWGSWEKFGRLTDLNGRFLSYNATRQAAILAHRSSHKNWLAARMDALLFQHRQMVISHMRAIRGTRSNGRVFAQARSLLGISFRANIILLQIALRQEVVKRILLLKFIILLCIIGHLNFFEQFFCALICSTIFQTGPVSGVITVSVIWTWWCEICHACSR